MVFYDEGWMGLKACCCGHDQEDHSKIGCLLCGCHNFEEETDDNKGWPTVECFSGPCVIEANGEKLYVPPGELFSSDFDYTKAGLYVEDEV